MFKREVVKSNMRCLAFVVSGVYALVAVAEPVVTVPSDLNPGDQYRLAFVTSGLTTALSSDIAIYNGFATAQAEGSAALASLGTTWTAIGSTAAISAKTNTGTDDSPAGPNGVPIYRLDGAIIADDYDDLWDGDIQNSISITQSGTIVSTCPGAWTGSVASGEIAVGNALGEAATVVDGSPGGTVLNWIQTNPQTAALPQCLYAISGVLTVLRPVTIQVDPTQKNECKNRKPVIVFGESEFDVRDIDVPSLGFGDSEAAGNPLCSLDYVNEDPYPDLVCKFIPGEGEAVLSGQLADGSPFNGADSICVTK